jgi:putative lipoic acid-binding regulatory protein
LILLYKLGLLKSLSVIAALSRDLLLHRTRTDAGSSPALRFALCRLFNQPRFFIFIDMDQQWFEKFRVQLDEFYAWPALYTFKFIVPTGKESEVKALFPNHTTSERPSKNGKYTSVTTEAMLPSSEAVIKIYEAAAKIEGILAL